MPSRSNRGNLNATSPVHSLVRSIAKHLNLGILLMVICPFFAFELAGWQAFFPVALSSLLGGTVCFLGQSIFIQIHAGQLTAELVQDLVSVDQHHQGMVLSRLSKTEHEWFLAELPRARAELRRRHWKPRKGIRASINWRWRLGLANKLA